MLAFARPVMRRVPLRQIRHVRAVRAAGATAPVVAVYRQMERDFGMLAPPVALHSPDPALLAAAWCMLRETLLAGGVLDRAVKEATAAAVSTANRCPYCVTVHGATLAGLLPGTGAARLAAGNLDTVSDPLVRAAAVWASGRAAPGELRLLAALPPAATAELAGVALTFHYLNRMVSVFLPPSPLPAGSPLARHGLTRLAARLMGRMARTVVPPGPAHEPLPGAPLPPDLAWAAPAPRVGEAMTHAVAVLTERAAHHLPTAVQDLVRDRLADPGDTGPGLSGRPWLDAAVAGLPAADQPAARLVLLTAFAAYQVTDPLVAQYRATEPADAALVSVTAWASLTAARRRTAALVAALDEAAEARP